GPEAMEKLNNEKSDLLYNAIDKSRIFRGTVLKEDRSKMNVCFVMDDPEKEKEFLEFSKQNNIYGIKGHRSVGGFRASLYNALPLSSVKYLVSKMEEFEAGLC